MHASASAIPPIYHHSASHVGASNASMGGSVSSSQSSTTNVPSNYKKRSRKNNSNFFTPSAILASARDAVGQTASGSSSSSSGVTSPTAPSPVPGYSTPSVMSPTHMHPTPPTRSPALTPNASASALHARSRSVASPLPLPVLPTNVSSSPLIASSSASTPPATTSLPPSALSTPRKLSLTSTASHSSSAQPQRVAHVRSPSGLLGPLQVHSHAPLAAHPYIDAPSHSHPADSFEHEQEPSRDIAPTSSASSADEQSLASERPITTPARTTHSSEVSSASSSSSTSPTAGSAKDVGDGVPIGVDAPASDTQLDASVHDASNHSNVKIPPLSHLKTDELTPSPNPASGDAFDFSSMNTSFVVKKPPFERSLSDDTMFSESTNNEFHGASIKMKRANRNTGGLLDMFVPPSEDEIMSHAAKGNDCEAAAQKKSKGLLSLFGGLNTQTADSPQPIVRDKFGQVDYSAMSDPWSYNPDEENCSFKPGSPSLLYNYSPSLSRASISRTDSRNSSLTPNGSGRASAASPFNVQRGNRTNSMSPAPVSPFPSPHHPIHISGNHHVHGNNNTTGNPNATNTNSNNTNIFINHHGNASTTSNATATATATHNAVHPHAPTNPSHHTHVFMRSQTLRDMALSSNSPHTSAHDTNSVQHIKPAMVKRKSMPLDARPNSSSGTKSSTRHNLDVEFDVDSDQDDGTDALCDLGASAHAHHPLVVTDEQRAHLHDDEDRDIVDALVDGYNRK